MPSKTPQELVSTPPPTPTAETQQSQALAAKMREAGVSDRAEFLAEAGKEEYSDEALGGGETTSPSNPQFYGR